MAVPLQIEFRNTQPIQDVDTLIRQEVAKLERSYHRLVSCRVDVELPEHARRGSVSNICLDLCVHAEDAVIPAAMRGDVVGDGGTEHMKIKVEHKDPSLGVHEAFITARRRLDEFTGAAEIS